MIPGIFNRRKSIGDNKIIKRINAKMSTGLFKGVSKAWEMWSKNLFILLYFFGLLRLVQIYLKRVKISVSKIN
jgi:hypothetical protein